MSDILTQRRRKRKPYVEQDANPTFVPENKVDNSYKAKPKKTYVRKSYSAGKDMTPKSNSPSSRGSAPAASSKPAASAKPKQSKPPGNFNKTPESTSYKPKQAKPPGNFNKTPEAPARIQPKQAKPPGNFQTATPTDTSDKTKKPIPAGQDWQAEWRKSQLRGQQQDWSFNQRKQIKQGRR